MSKPADDGFLSTTSLFSSGQINRQCLFRDTSKSWETSTRWVGRYGHLVISFQTFWSDSLNVSMKAGLTSPEWWNGFPYKSPNREPSQKKRICQSTNIFDLLFFWKKTSQWKVTIKSGGIFWFGWFGAFHVKMKFEIRKFPRTDFGRIPGAEGGELCPDLGRLLRTGRFSYMDAKNLW